MSAIDDLLREIAEPSRISRNTDTYDLARARTLDVTDRRTYLARLIENAGQGDTRAILTLGHLQATDALPMLRMHAAGNTPWAATSRRALVLLGHGDEVLDAIANDALDGHARADRVAAVLDLPKVGGPKAVAALAAVLEDAEPYMRMIAWNGLVAAFELEPLMRSPEGNLRTGTRLELFKDMLASDVTAMVKIGAGSMRATLARVAGGEDPVALGITYRPDPAPEVTDTIVTAVDHDIPYPVEEMALLTGLARQRAEARLALRIEHEDERVPDALAQLGATWTIPVMEEVAAWRSISPGLASKLGDAARRLRALRERDVARSESTGARATAIRDLRSKGGSNAIESLQHALLDEHKDIRLAAWGMLIDALGLAKRLESPEGVREVTTEIEVMRVLLGSDIKALVKIGASGMRETARRLAAGATPQQLGIAWRQQQSEDVFENLRATLIDTDAPFPLEQIAELKGVTRQLAETMIVLRLEEWDARVPGALVVLDAAWTVPALEELASSPDVPDELREKLASAARELHTT